MEEAALLPPWDVYSRLQKRAKYTCTIDSRGWGLEEEMNFFLDNPDAYAQVKSETQLKKTNASAARRERAQAQMRKNHEAELAPEPVNPERQHDVREKLRLIEGSMKPADWQVLVKVAEGHSHKEIASTTGIKPGTLRVMVSRLRAEVLHVYAA
jgi:hypothetical protein